MEVRWSSDGDNPMDLPSLVGHAHPNSSIRFPVIPGNEVGQVPKIWSKMSVYGWVVFRPWVWTNSFPSPCPTRKALQIRLWEFSFFDADKSFDVLKYFKGSAKYESALFSSKNYGPVLTSYLNCFLYSSNYL